ncbi:unnamed protein product [Rhizophagus irregularis]|nr:unnamed protein product [Rhizophagus irregularis]CAB5343186.1 unnamed protein product [Rhizophagus irregularis]
MLWIDTRYIKRENAIHGDLHSGNILYSQLNDSWYISDLGFCGPIDKPPKTFLSKLNDFNIHNINEFNISNKQNNDNEQLPKEFKKLQINSNNDEKEIIQQQIKRQNNNNADDDNETYNHPNPHLKEQDELENPDGK